MIIFASYYRFILVISLTGGISQIKTAVFCGIVIERLMDTEVIFNTMHHVLSSIVMPMKNNFSAMKL